MNQLTKTLFAHYSKEIYSSLPDEPEATAAQEELFKFIQKYDKTAQEALVTRIDKCADAREWQGFMRGVRFAMRLMMDSGATHN